MFLVINSTPATKLAIPKATKLNISYCDGRPHIICNEETKLALLELGLIEIKGRGMTCDKPMELTCD